MCVCVYVCMYVFFVLQVPASRTVPANFDAVTNNGFDTTSTQSALANGLYLFPAVVEVPGT